MSAKAKQQIVRDAAERIVAPYDEVYWDGNSSEGDPQQDAILVAHDWISEHPADDGEAVTEEFVASLPPLPLKLSIGTTGGFLGTVTIWKNEYEWLHLPGRYETRGQLRRLLAALGVTT